MSSRSNENEVLEHVATSGRVESRESLIKKALSFPFYQWFWDNEERPYEELPVLTKNDLFRYEALTGRNYYEGYEKSMPASYVFFATTGGTLGNLLKVPHSYHEIAIFFRSIARNISIFAGAKPKMIVPPILSPSEVIYHIVNAPIRNEIVREEIYQKEIEPYIELVEAPYEEMPKKVVEDPGINAIWDLQGMNLYKYFIEEHKDMGNLRVILRNVLHPSVKKAVLKSGINSVAPFMAADVPMSLGRSCVDFVPFLFHVNEELPGFVRVKNKDGKITEEGEGELIVDTDMPMPFPLIKYSVGDIVRLSYVKCERCGYEGIDLKLIGRHIREVRIRDASGPEINIDKLIADLSGFGELLVIYGRLKSSYAPDENEFLGLVTFLETDVDKPMLTNQFLPIILQGFPSFSKYAMPTIIVPKRTIVDIRVKDQKPRTFIDVTHRFPSLYEPLRELARELGYTIL